MYIHRDNFGHVPRPDHMTPRHVTKFYRTTFYRQHLLIRKAYVAPLSRTQLHQRFHIKRLSSAAVALKVYLS